MTITVSRSFMAINGTLSSPSIVDSIRRPDAMPGDHGIRSTAAQRLGSDSYGNGSPEEKTRIPR